MHLNPAVKLGCTDCHGGNSARAPDRRRAARHATRTRRRCESAHVLPRFPEVVALPVQRQSRAHVHAAEPREPRVRPLHQSLRLSHRARSPAARATWRSSKRRCAACMSTGAMFWGGAAYNNGILDFKQYILGEAYDRNGEAVGAEGPEDPRRPGRRRGGREHPAAALSAAGWETLKPGDIFRVFERGGRNIAQPVPRDRPAERGRPAAAHRGAGPARLPPVQSRAGHRRAHRRAGDQHHQDAPQRSAHVVHRHQRSARRLPPLGLRVVPRRVRERSRSAAFGRRTRSSATRARRRPSIRRSARPSPAIRSRTR